jgi:hypothetical protein
MRMLSYSEWVAQNSKTNPNYLEINSLVLILDGYHNEYPELIKLKNLKKLTLFVRNAKNLDFLAHLTNLRILKIYAHTESVIYNFASLYINLINLESLCVYGYFGASNLITNFNFLENCKNLKNLVFPISCDSFDFNGIQKFKKLHRLRIDAPMVDFLNFDILKTQTNIKEFDFGLSKIDLNCLHPYIRVLKCNKIVNVEALAKFKSLKFVEFKSEKFQMNLQIANNFCGTNYKDSQMFDKLFDLYRNKEFEIVNQLAKGLKIPNRILKFFKSYSKHIYTGAYRFGIL